MGWMTGLLPTTTPAGTRHRHAAPASGVSAAPDPAGQSRPLLMAGLRAAASAAGLGLLTVTVLVLLGWSTAAESGASAGEALRSAVQVWLVGHGAALAVPGGRFSVGPLGLMALPAVLLYLAAARATRAEAVQSLRPAVSLTAVLAGAYAVLSALLALLARTDDVRPLPVSAFLAAGLLATVAGGAGALRAAGCWPGLWRRLPTPVRLAAAGGGTALATLVAGGALVAAAALAAHHDRAVELIRGLDAGTLGGLLLFLVCLLYAPTAVVWSTSYVSGPGFAVGAGTVVSPWGTELGAAPSFPLLAALPAGDGAGLTYLVLGVPLAAGVLAGLLTDRRDRRLASPQLTGRRPVAGVGMGVGAAAGLAFALLTAVTSGAAGPGRLGEAGPPWWSCLVVAVEIGVVATVTLLVRRPGLLHPAKG